MSFKYSENLQIKNLNSTFIDEDKNIKLELLMGVKDSLRNPT